MQNFFWDYSDTTLPLIVLLLLLPHFIKKPRGLRLFFVYLLMTVIIMGYSNYLADRSRNNLYLYHFYSLIEILLVVPMINRFAGRKKTVMFTVIGLYLFFWIVNVIAWEPFSKFNNNTSSVAALLISFFCFRYFLSLASQKNVLYFQKLPSFWIVSGFLFYCFVGVLILVSYRYKENFTGIDPHLMWKVQQVSNIIKFVFLLIGSVCCYRQELRLGSL